VSTTAKMKFEDREHGQAVVAVVTSICFYHVAITPTKVTVTGPGIERDFEEEIPEGLSYIGQAIIAVTILEEER
jgi:hypothetical protein